MNTAPHSDDPLVNAITQDAQNLPLQAAASARSRKSAESKRIHAYVIVGLLLLGWASWQFDHRPLQPTPSERIYSSAMPADPSLTENYVKISHTSELTERSMSPSNSLDRENQLLAQLSGVGVLIVKDTAGGVARVHIFDR
jgi:hypothetical protein